MLRSKKGATLFEMLVVMAIIGIIAILVLAGYRTAQKNYALSGASQRLMADFRQAQGMAIAGAEVAGYSPQGYGIYIQNANFYLLFIKMID
jgi:type II secretion system protein H